jgi:hypothetical protein
LDFINTAFSKVRSSIRTPLLSSLAKLVLKMHEHNCSQVLDLNGVIKLSLRLCAPLDLFSSGGNDNLLNC